MSSLLLQTVAKYLVPAQFIYSIFLLLRGHNDPGGGFSAGLVVMAAVGLYGIAYTAEQAKRLLILEPLSIAGLGIGFAVIAGVIALFGGDAFLTGLWLDLDLGFTELHIGTPLIFDTGVYLLVLGGGSAVLLGLME